jgi:hypothetical protein
LRRADNCLFLLFYVCSQSSCRRDPIIYMSYGSYPSSRIASSDSHDYLGVLFLPETKNRTLGEIDEMYAAAIIMRKWRGMSLSRELFTGILYWFFFYRLQDYRNNQCCYGSNRKKICHYLLANIYLLLLDRLILLFGILVTLPV